MGVKAELEKSARQWRAIEPEDVSMESDSDDDAQASGGTSKTLARGVGSANWVEVSVDIPGFREDDSLPVFLSAMLTEALTASTTLQDRLFINPRWHWKLYIDVLLLSSPLAYPLPLLSLTTHLALLHTHLPRPTSEPADDPLFDDDWDAAVPLYPREAGGDRPPVTLLVMTVGNNIFFDPSREELAVADAVLAISFTTGVDSKQLRILAIRTVDPPSRLTPPGIPDDLNPATATGAAAAAAQNVLSASATVTLAVEKSAVWTPPRGGVHRALLSKIMYLVLEPTGVGHEVLDGLAAVET